MTVSIAGTALNENLTLTGPGNEPRALVSARQTLGRVVVQRHPVAGGQQLILSALRIDGGLLGEFTIAQWDLLAALRDAGQPVQLIHHRGSFRVIILAVDLSPASGVVDPDATARLIGSITMLEV